MMELLFHDRLPGLVPTPEGTQFSPGTVKVFPDASNQKTKAVSLQFLLSVNSFCHCQPDPKVHKLFFVPSYFSWTQQPGIH